MAFSPCLSTAFIQRCSYRSCTTSPSFYWCWPANYKLIPGILGQGGLYFAISAVRRTLPSEGSLRKRKLSKTYYVASTPSFLLCLCAFLFVAGSFTCGQVMSLRPFVPQTFSSFQTPSISWLSWQVVQETGPRISSDLVKACRAHGLWGVFVCKSLQVTCVCQLPVLQWHCLFRWWQSLPQLVPADQRFTYVFSPPVQKSNRDFILALFSIIGRLIWNWLYHMLLKQALVENTLHLISLLKGTLWGNKHLQKLPGLLHRIV